MVHLLHKDKEHLASRNKFRATRKFLIAKFDCTVQQRKWNLKLSQFEIWNASLRCSFHGLHTIFFHHWIYEHELWCKPLRFSWLIKSKQVHFTKLTRKKAQKKIITVNFSRYGTLTCLFQALTMCNRLNYFLKEHLLINVNIFLEGHKVGRRGRFCKILRPSQNIWTLSVTIVSWVRVWFEIV